MTKKTWIVLLGLSFITSCVVYIPYGGEGGPPPGERERTYGEDYRTYPEETDISFFYDYLSPHGIWVALSPYGYVWVPRHVSWKWRPYTSGRWVWTQYGWTWASYDPWGWIPYHYGRWGRDKHLGWFWVPGTDWSPAWVTWQWNNLYIGWAPLPPEAEFVMGTGITGLPYDFPADTWIFIEGRYFQHEYIDRYILPFERNTTIIKFTVNKANLSVKNRRLINPGVDIEQVQRVTRGDVYKYELEDVGRPQETKVSGDVVTIYRPPVKKDEAAKPKVFWPKNEADEKLQEVRIKDLEEETSSDEAEVRLQRDQEKEMRLLEQSQRTESAEMKRKAEDEKKLAATAAEQQKIEKDYEVKSKELQKDHQEEKAKLTERQQEEGKAVKKSPKKKE